LHIEAMSHQEPAVTEEFLAPPDPDDEPFRDLTGVTLGDFQVKRLLGRGGMGQVYLATQLSLNRPVALKVLHTRFLSKPAYLSRFEAEATAVAKLNHPNIVHVYTLGAIDQVRFISLEYVEGTNLREYIERKGALELPLALSIMRQAAQGIGAAGELGLVHRDIKPENLLLTRRGQAKVADFGLCRDLESDRFHVTQPGITMGTPLYMSPEQAQGKHLDHRSDLYSLGVTFYHMLVGEPPFRADSAVALALKHVSEAPLGLRIRRPEIPIELENLVLKLMAKSPEDRYQSAAEMLADLAKIRSTLIPAGGTASLPDVRPISMPRAETPTQATTASTDALPASSRPQPVVAIPTGRRMLGPWSLAAAGLMCIAVGGLGGWASRPVGLTEPTSGTPRMPLLGLEPRWLAIPAQSSAEDQYRFAQIQASEDDRTAAWLAVPGRFPSDRQWISLAYLQLARRMYRQRDLGGLLALRSELAAWPGAKTADQQLAEIAETALKLCHKDYDGVLKGIVGVTGLDERVKGLARDEPSLYDPGRLEFCVEILADAARLVAQPGSGVGAMERDRLVAMQARLHSFLRRVQLKEWLGIGR
jgi:serine/threonine-protein kinase